MAYNPGVFRGNDLDLWVNHFSFSSSFAEKLRSLGANCVEDLNLIYSDSEILGELELSTRRLDFRKFKVVKDWTNVDSPPVPPSTVAVAATAKYQKKNANDDQPKKSVNQWICTLCKDKNEQDVLKCRTCFTAKAEEVVVAAPIPPLAAAPAVTHANKPVGITTDLKPSASSAAVTAAPAPALATKRSEDTPVAKKMPSTSASSRIGKSTAIVLDGGSYNIRAGFAGEDKPACIMRSSMTRMRQKGDGFKATGEFVYGSICDSPDLDADLPINFIKDGVVTDWNAMEKMWHHIFSTQQLQVDPKDHPVLLTERQLGPIANREQATQVMFETFEIPAFCLYYATTLQMYGSGRRNGMILDCGEYACTAVPFYEGYCFPFATNRTLIGGLDIDKRLHTLQERYIHTDDHIMVRELQQTKSLKEVFANVSPTADITPDDGLWREYQPPDGHKINESPVKGQQCAEVLFNPYLVGKEALGIHDLLLKSLMMCVVDFRQGMAANIVIAGGTSCLPGLQARLTHELFALFPSKYNVKVILGGVNLAWEGGSVLASSSEFPSLCITKAEYDEVGPSIIRRRF